MNHPLILILSLSIIIPALAAVLKIKKVDKMFYPFIFCIWIAALNELLSALLSYFNINTANNNNIYVLAEAILIGWQFKNWGLFSFSKNALWLYIVPVALIWVLDTSFLYDLHLIKSGFRIICSFLIVLMSIMVNNKLVYHHKGSLLKSPVFFICTALIVYFTFKIFIEAFLLYGLSVSPVFYTALFIILAWINFFTNLLFTYAVLCIPKKIYYIESF